MFGHGGFPLGTWPARTAGGLLHSHGGHCRQSRLSALPKNKLIFPQHEPSDPHVPVSGNGEARMLAGSKVVAIPLLNTLVGSHGISGDACLNLDAAVATDMVAVPAAWCPNPGTTSCVRVTGVSMQPALADGDILAVDYSITNQDLLDGKFVISRHKAKGLFVSRFRSYGGARVLEAENRDYEPVVLGCDRAWKIVGKVLWWTRFAP